jgi:hypothetical protein
VGGKIDEVREALVGWVAITISESALVEIFSVENVT